MDIPSPDKHLSVQQMEPLRQAFIIFDRDRDGHINKQELAMVCCSVVKVDHQKYQDQKDLLNLPFYRAMNFY